MAVSRRAADPAGAQQPVTTKANLLTPPEQHFGVPVDRRESVRSRFASRRWSKISCGGRGSMVPAHGRVHSGQGRMLVRTARRCRVLSSSKPDRCAAKDGRPRRNMIRHEQCSATRALNCWPPGSQPLRRRSHRQHCRVISETSGVAMRWWCRLAACRRQPRKARF